MRRGRGSARLKCTPAPGPSCTRGLTPSRSPGYGPRAVGSLPAKLTPRPLKLSDARDSTWTSRTDGNLRSQQLGTFCETPLQSLRVSRLPSLRCVSDARGSGRAASRPSSGCVGPKLEGASRVTLCLSSRGKGGRAARQVNPVVLCVPKHPSSRYILKQKMASSKPIIFAFLWVLAWDLWASISGNLSTVFFLLGWERI